MTLRIYIVRYLNINEYLSLFCAYIHLFVSSDAKCYYACTIFTGKKSKFINKYYMNMWTRVLQNMKACTQC